jgi:prevent-host-death family protein
MAEIGITDFKSTASAVIDRVQGGAAYVITRRGRPAAVLLPIQEAEDLVLATADQYLTLRWEARAAHREDRTLRLDDLG